MDTWTDVFIDEKNIRRCRRCQHARPIQYTDLEKSPYQKQQRQQQSAPSSNTNMTTTEAK